MPIKVYFGNRENAPFPIESDAGKLKLPSVFIEPLDANNAIVSIKSIRVRILQGDNRGQLVLGPAYAVDGFLKQFEKPHKLTGRLECPPFARQIKKKDELPAGEYQFRADVAYEQHMPWEKPGPDAEAYGIRSMLVGGLEYEVGVKAGWRKKELVIGLSAAELILYVENAPRASSLIVSVSDPDRPRFPALYSALNHHLSLNRPAHLGRQGDVDVFEQKIDFRYDEPDKDQALKEAPFSVDVRVSIMKRQGGGVADKALRTIALTGKHGLVIDFKDNMFPGYPILDLGTSSTFALIHYYHKQTGDVPIEQEQTIRYSVQTWLNRKDGPFAMREWPAILQNATKYLSGGERCTQPDEATSVIRNYLKQKPPPPYGTDTALHTVLRALEIAACASNLSPDFRLPLRRELATMYTQAFRRFPLEQQRLKAVELDSNNATSEALAKPGAIVAPIPSTTEVKVTKPLAVDIGYEAESNRLSAAAANPSALVTRFHSSPKIYYPLLGRPSERINVSADGPAESVAPRSFLVAALKQLRDRMEKFRDGSDDLPKAKRFSKIVMPFPTSAPLSVRNELLEAMKEAGFDEPNVDLDEALSAVVFYLVSPFGVDLEMGLEAFRTSCRPVARGPGLLPIEWKQNILLIDVGGGTTDIALIEVTLEDLQAKGTGDGSKGRYYRLTPKLLGATGQAQLAGNLLSLGVFHAIKKRLADAVLTALQSTSPTGTPATGEAQRTGETANWQRLLKVAASIPASLRAKGGDTYRAGAILEHYRIHQLWQKKGEEFDAFQLANEVLPTAWKSDKTTDIARTAAARSFHVLWQLADDMKIQVFGAATASEAEPSATVNIDQIAELLGISPAACQSAGIAPITIGRDEFWESIDLPLREIAKLALDLTVTSLPLNKTPQNEDETERTLPGILDQIVLTGQTCRLGRARDVIKRTFQMEADSTNARIRWDPNALTFDGDYAKQAAALGAAYAQMLKEGRFAPKSVEAQLRENVLDIDIQNLFFFLQSGFDVRNPNSARGRDTLLTPGMPFREFDSDGIGHLRSGWLIAPRETLNIDRFDFVGASVPWGHFDCKGLVETLGITLKQFLDEIRMAISTDHRLIVSVLFCRGREPHYELPIGGEAINIPEILRQLKILPDAMPADMNIRPTEAASDTWMTALGDWDVGINVYSAFSGDSAYLFRLAPTELTKTLRHPNDKSKKYRAELSAELPPCSDEGDDIFYVRRRNGAQKWTEIGRLKRPQPIKGRRISTRALLDETGQLRIHLGELPLYLARSEKDLLDHGVVLKKSLNSAPPLRDDLRNPFCGRH